MYCEKCGKRMGENDAFCTSCGAKKNSLDVITYGTNKNVSEKKNKKLS